MYIASQNSQTNRLAWDNLPKHWNFMLFYTIWDLVELFFVWYFYVETRGPTLEEIARIFDGEDAVAHIDMSQVEKDVVRPSHHHHEELRAAEDAQEKQV